MEAKIKEAIERSGIAAPNTIVIDGQFHRFSTNGKRGDRAGYYCVWDHGDGFLAWVFGDWRSGVHQNGHSKEGQVLRRAEQAQVNSAIKEANEKAEAERKRKAEQAKAVGNRLLAKAKAPDSDHPYLMAKGIKPVEPARQVGDCLVVPVENSERELQGAQLIYPDGKKRFITGTSKAGAYSVIPGTGKKIYISEGYATGASVHMATGAMVIIAFDAGNLKPVTKVIREAHPEAMIVICADNDQWTEGNPGLTKATEAAQAVGGLLAVPHFSDISEKPTDFNDLHRIEGLEAVRGCLAKAKPAKGLVLTPLSEVEAEETQWLWEPYIPSGKLTLLEGNPGDCKTWVALAICAKEVQKGHMVVYASCEDRAGDTLKPRVEAIQPGLDLRRFLILEGKQGEGAITEPFTLKDMPELEQVLIAYRPSLVVLDPIQGFLGGEIDMHRANQVRAKLAGIIKLAEKYSCAFLLVRHLAKARAERAIFRGLGSIDFSAAARSILLVGEKDGTRVMVQVKNSLSQKGPSLAFEVKEGRFLWLGETDAGASDLMGPEERRGGKTKLAQAMDFLSEALSSGPKSEKRIKREAASLGISQSTLRRAREKLEIITSPERDEKGKMRGWTWSLPPGDQCLSDQLKAQHDHLDERPEIRVNTVPCPDAQGVPHGHLDSSEEYQPVTESEPDDQRGSSGGALSDGRLSNREASQKSPSSRKNVSPEEAFVF